MTLIREAYSDADFVEDSTPADLSFDPQGGSMIVLLSAQRYIADQYSSGFPKFNSVSGKKRSDNVFDGFTALLHYWRGQDGEQHTMEFDLDSSDRFGYAVMSFSGHAYLGRIIEFDDGDGIATWTLEDVPANSKVYLFLHSRQYTFSESTGATELGQEQWGTSTENIWALFEKTNGSSDGDVSFTTTRPGGRSTAAVLFEVVPLVGGVQIASMWDYVFPSSSDPYNFDFYGKGSHLGVFGTPFNDASSSPLTDITYAGASLTEEASVEASNRFAILWSLLSPSSGWNTVSVDSSDATPGTSIYGALSWKGTRGIVQTKSVADPSDPFTLAFDNNTEVGSKCYCVIGRAGSGGSGEFTDGARHLFDIGTDEHMSVGEKDGDGTQVSFTFDSNSERDDAAIIWEMGVGGAGNRMILMMSKIMDKWLKNRGLLVPPELGRIYQPQPQILTPTARQVKALAA